MRIITLVLALLTFMVVSVQAQYHGKCGNFRYTINGKLISSVDVNSGAEMYHVNTYYSIDPKNGYIWFWVEESFAGSNKTAKFLTLWSRLSDLNNQSALIDTNNPTSIVVSLSSQKFFFTTAYTAKIKGPQYEVRSKLPIRFTSNQDAIDFSKELLQYIPNY